MATQPVVYIKGKPDKQHIGTTIQHLRAEFPNCYLIPKSDPTGSIRIPEFVLQNVEYDLVEVAPPTSDLKLIEDKLNQLIVEFRAQKEPSEISISKLSSKTWKRFCSQFPCKEKNLKLKKSPPPHPKSSANLDLGYVWDIGKTEVAQMDKVMEWLRGILDLPSDSELTPIDVSGNKTLFCMPRNLDVKLKGTTDIAFIDEGTAVLGKNFAVGIKICIEVKKQVKDSHLLQAKAQLFACDMVSHHEPLVFLTDLNKDWTLLFFQKSNLVISRISFQTAIDTIKATCCITKKKKDVFKWDISKELKPTRYFNAKKFGKEEQDYADLTSLLDSLPEEDQIEVKQELYWNRVLATPSFAALSYYS